MDNKQQPTKHEYALLEKLSNNATCYIRSTGPWRVAPVLVSEGPALVVSASTVFGLKCHAWAEARYVRRDKMTYLVLTDAGRKAYEDERRGRSECMT